MTSWTIRTPQRLTVSEPVDQLAVELVNGRVNVVATEGPARIEISSVGRHPIHVVHTDGRLAVRDRKPPGGPDFLRWFGRRFNSEISIGVPARTRVDLRLINGSVVASGLAVATEVEVTSGQVTLMGLGGQTSARVLHGSVEALGVAGELRMKTVSGEVILADSPAEMVRASTISGAIICDIDNPKGREIQLASTSGSVTVRVRRDSDLDVDLHSTAGHITTDFPQLAGSGPKRSPASRRGTLGAGGGRLRASTTSGSILLLSRPAVAEE